MSHSAELGNGYKTNCLIVVFWAKSNCTNFWRTWRYCIGDGLKLITLLCANLRKKDIWYTSVFYSNMNNLVAENYFTLGKASPKVISLKFPMSSLSFVQNMHVCFEEAKQNINGSYCLWHYYTVKWFAFNVHIFPIEHNDLQQYGTQLVTILWLLLFTWC